MSVEDSLLSLWCGLLVPRELHGELSFALQTTDDKMASMQRQATAESTR